MREIGHFIGGKHVKGTSGRTADVFQPMTGEVIARVALASKAELRAAVENAKAAQPAWANTNPQRRARVMFKFLELMQRDNDALADLLAREHGKTIADARGDIQRGVEVVEFACGIPHLMKGEFSDSAGSGHRPLFHAPALGRGRRHHAVQFPGHDPDVEVRAGDRLRQRLHPEAVGTRPGRADAARRADARSGPARRHSQCRQWRQGSGRRDPRRSGHPRHRLRRVDGRSPSTSIRAAPRAESACRPSAAPRTT